MTRKDYKLIEWVLHVHMRRMTTQKEASDFLLLVEDMEAGLRRDNERFRKDKFHDAVYEGVGL